MAEVNVVVNLTTPTPLGVTGLNTGLELLSSVASAYIAVANAPTAVVSSPTAFLSLATPGETNSLMETVEYADVIDYFGQTPAPQQLVIALTSNANSGTGTTQALTQAWLSNPIWSPVHIGSANALDLEAASAWCNTSANGPHTFWFETPESTILTGSAGDVPYALCALNSVNSIATYNVNAHQPDSWYTTNAGATDGPVGAAFMGWVCAHNWGTFTLYGQAVNGIVPVTLTPTQSYNAHETHNVNTYEVIAGSPWLQSGYTLSTTNLTAEHTWIDTVLFGQQLQINLQTAAMNATRVLGGKLPYTQAGLDKMYQALKSVFDGFVNLGDNAPIGQNTYYTNSIGIKTQNGGYVINMPNFNTLTQADLNTRALGTPVGSIPASTTNQPITFTVWYTGAIHSAVINGQLLLG